ncbi:MAG: hypothetical protein FJ270_03150, partial [Planctomycetes bacterium]|nr:hypothetical protein [Planctomycetota bacterium]
MTINRRSFIAATAATVAAPSFLAPRALGDDPLPPPIGSGSQRYAVNHSFLSPLQGTSWGDTHGVAQDAAGRIYLAHTVGGGSEKPLAVCVYEADGRAIGGWGTDFAGGAHGLDLRKEGDQEFLYHCDTRRRCVVKTALDGTVVWTATCPMQSGVYGSAS